MLRMKSVIRQRLSDRQVFLLRDGGEMIANEFDRFLIDERIVAERARIHGDIEYRWIRRAFRKRRNRRIDRSDAEFDGFQTADAAETGVAMGVKLNGDAIRFLQQNRNEPARSFGCEKPRSEEHTSELQS